MEREEIKTIVVKCGANGNKRIYSPKGFEARVKRERYCHSYSEQLQSLFKYNVVYGAKWTPNGLIYTHVMNEKGEFEPIEHIVELKAKAFDIIRKYVPNIVLEDKQLIVINFGYCSDRNDLSQEEYEILKKAGVE